MRSAWSFRIDGAGQDGEAEGARSESKQDKRDTLRTGDEGFISCSQVKEDAIRDARDAAAVTLGDGTAAPSAAGRELTGMAGVADRPQHFGRAREVGMRCFW